MDLPTSEHQIIIETDEAKIESVITNLVKNAVKYSEKGHIVVGYEIVGDTIQFFCKDDGIGIPENRQKAIFNRFEQSDIEDKSVFEGSGLGLAICKAYVEMLGGKIWVDSIEGEGSTFTFTLPYQDQNIDAGEKTTLTKSLPTEDRNIKRQLNILIVEDDSISRSYLETVLAGQNVRLYSAISGTEAIDIMKKHSEIDLILMDIKLPGMDGYETTRTIRGFNPQVKIIAQSAYAFKTDHNKALAAGCDDYIPKPVNAELLLEKIMALQFD